MKHCLSAMIRYGVFLILLLLTFGCRKDLCYDHELHSASVKTVVAADWEQEWERVYDFDWEQNWNVLWGREYDELRPDIAEGIRALVYSAGGGFSENNLSAEGGRLPMKEGVYSLLFYNNDTEYILFNDLTTSASASATTRTRTRGGFKELHAGERTVSPPDMLYGAYVKEHFAERTLESIELPVIMRPLTYTYLIRYEFKKGAQYVALARGALAGMAESVYLEDGHTGADAVTVMFDCTVEDFGAEALVYSFGVPDYPGDHYVMGRQGKHYALNLELRMLNGKFKTFEFDVTDQVTGQPRGGVIVVKDIEISDEEGTEGSGSFDVTVDGWGEYIDVELPLN